MKKLLLILMLILPIVGMSQPIYKFTARSYTQRSFNDTKNTWNAWGEWEDIKIIIVINSDENTMVIYSQREQKYDFITFSDGEEMGEYTRYTMDGIDEEGIECVISMLKYHDPDTPNQITIRWSNVQIAYAVYVSN